MLNSNSINGHIHNGEQIVVQRMYKEKNKTFEIYAIFGRYKNKIRLELRDYDTELDKNYGMLESEIPAKRHEVKDFMTVEKVLDYIFKTTILTEEDFPRKFKVKKIVK